MIYDAIIIGAGASGLMCAIRLGALEQSCLILEKSESAGKKILISGGGRCNFTNLNTNSSAYLSDNPYFCKSALARFTPWHFIELLNKHGLHYHEKKAGQLFCDEKSAAIVKMLLDESKAANTSIQYNQNIDQINKIKNIYHIKSNNQTYLCNNLVIATGGPSIPKIGASAFALTVAKQFKIDKIPFSPALVPLTFNQQSFKMLSGISVDAEVSCQTGRFRDNILFTHRGLSGPAILQISSYWKKGLPIKINLLPEIIDPNWIISEKNNYPKKQLNTLLMTFFAKKFIDFWYKQQNISNKTLNQYAHKELQQIQNQLQNWQLLPDGNEGLKKAEVSLGGICTNALSSKTLMTHQQKGLYFIGEAVNVVGWLGGYNFQWAFSSGWCAAEAIANHP